MKLGMIREVAWLMKLGMFFFFEKMKQGLLRGVWEMKLWMLWEKMRHVKLEISLSVVGGVVGKDVADEVGYVVEEKMA